MVETKEKNNQEIEVRQMSVDILASSGDILNVEVLEVLATLMPRIEMYLSERKQSNWVPEGHHLTLEQECGLNLFFNVVNFCYKDPESNREYIFSPKDDVQLRRSSGLLAAMARSGVNWDDFSEIEKMSAEEWAQMTQISEVNPMYLGNERWQRIKGFAEHLSSLGFRNMDELLNGCDFNASSLLKILGESGYFTDDFQKRSQLACRMINDVWMRRGGYRLTNIDKLTVMADYRIPQVFYNLGVVSINNPSLLNDLLSEQPIEANSRKERALRATAVFIGQIVASEMKITEAEVDSILWGLSQEMVRKGELRIPHMIVATDAY